MRIKTRKYISMLLILCMVLSILPGTGVKAAEPEVDSTDQIITVEKYDEEGNGTFLLLPKRVSYSNNYASTWITNAVGSSNIEIGERSFITGYKDSSQEDGWLRNGDISDTSKWIMSVNGTGFEDMNYFYTSSVKVMRVIFTPAGNGTDVGGTTDGIGWRTVCEMEVDKNDLIEYLSRFNTDDFAEGSNRAETYQAALDTVLNPDATQDEVDSALINFRDAEDAAADIEISDETVDMYIGGEKTVTARLLPVGSTDELTWTSDNEGIAAVDNGIIRGVGAGTAKIKVSAGALEKEITVNVKEIDSITITSLGNPSSIEATTQSLNLTAVILPLNEVKHVEWSVDNPDIATVTPASNEIYASVKGLQAGSVVITAKVGSKMASYNLEVTPYTGPYVYFECEDGTVKRPDENGYMSLTALDVGEFVVGGTYSGTPVWSCSGWVQSVNGDNQWHTFINPETGKYLPYGLGDLTVTVNAGGWSRTFTIQRESSGITELKTYVNGKEVTMDDPYTVVGTISGVTVNVQGKNADGNWVAVPTQALYYTSNNSNGSFRFVGNQMSITSGGEAEMIVSMVEDYSITTSFRAVCGEVAVESFEVIYPSTWTIDGSWDRMSNTFVGLGTNVGLKWTPENATNRNVTWEALTPDIAVYIPEHGCGITPKKAGIAKFRVTSENNPEAVREIEIEFVYENPLQKAEISQTEYTLNEGDMVTLDITAIPANASDQTFVWSYSRDGIVKVEDLHMADDSNGGLNQWIKHNLTAYKEGSVTVTGTPVDDTAGCAPIIFTVTVNGTETDEPVDYMPVVKDGIQHGLNYLKDTSHSKYGDEWNIFTILRSGGEISEEDRAAYLESVEKTLERGGLEQPTDYARVILTLGVLGENPENFNGKNLTEKLYNWKGLDYLTSNQPCWTLIALDSKKYEIPGDALWSRDELIRLLLAFRNKDGSFALSGTAGDVDMTGMILQALAPYNNESHPDVQAAFKDALIWLQGQMKGTAGFSENAGGNENSCSTAQILTALSVAGIDPLDKNNGFTLGNHNMITNLYSYKAESGFCWEENGGGNMMGTYQVTYALEAYRRYAENENPLYDLTDLENEDPNEPRQELPYKDVKEGDWFYDYVYDVYIKKLMTGLDTDVFGPDRNLVRAQFAVILYRMEGEPEVIFKETFPDVADGLFYSKAVIWAAENKIVTGYTSTGAFGSNDPITREQMAVMMFRYANYKGLDTSESKELSSFPDDEKVQEFAVGALQWCAAKEIITGKGEEKALAPQGSTNRAECATIISRYTGIAE